LYSLTLGVKVDEERNRFLPKGESVQVQTQPKRAQVPVEQTWDLSDLFDTREAWIAELNQIEADLSTVTRHRGKLGESAAALLTCLNDQEALYARYSRVATYAELQSAADGSDPRNQEDAARAAALGAKLESACAFIKSEILSLPDGTVERFMAEEPKLAELRLHLERMLEEKPHMLLPETEEALAALGEIHEAPYMIYLRTKSADMRFPNFTTPDGKEHPLSFASYEEHLETVPQVEIRRAAYKAFSRGLANYKHTLAATFATEVRKNVVMAKLRGYRSATEMLLQPQQVPVEAYENLLNIIQSELAPHMRRYAYLRRRVLGLDKLLYCDIEAPLDPDYNPPTTYAEAKELILDALSVMGPEYIQIIRRALTERWVDTADNEGKSTGAFCSWPYGSHSYILMTWTDNMRSAFTLIHELGHAGHFELAQVRQRLFNTEPSTFFVEAPSTMNELLLAQHLLKQTTDVRMRRWVLMQTLATYHHNFVRHLLEAELQRRIYARAETGEPITADTLCAEKSDILRRFWGDAVEIDEDAGLTWMRQPHYYMGLYPYTYSAGLTCSTAMAQAIQAEGQPAVDRWLAVLKAGGTKRPLELMQMAGVDLTRPDPIRSAVAYVGSLVSALEETYQ